MSGSGSAFPSFPEGEGPASVALLEHPWSMTRHRSLIALRRGGAENAYELWDFEPPSLFDAILGKVKAATVRLADDYANAVEVLSFTLPEGASPAAVAAKLADLLGGKPAGFYAVVRSQNGFHEAHEAFTLLHRAVGCPPLTVRKLSSGMAGGTTDVFDAAKTHRAVAAGINERDRAQRFGARVHYGGVPPCPACGKELVRHRGRHICEELITPAEVAADGAGVGPTMAWIDQAGNEQGDELA